LPDFIHYGLKLTGDSIQDIADRAQRDIDTKQSAHDLANTQEAAVLNAVSVRPVKSPLRGR
jgi:hypothetical protein